MNRNKTLVRIVMVCLFLGVTTSIAAQSNKISGLKLIVQNDESVQGWIDEYEFEEPVSAGTIHYIDPVNGSSWADGGRGTSANPWRTLQEVVDEGLVEYYAYTVAYPDSNSPLVVFNAGAPVKGGDTLLLRDGYHGHLTVNRFNFMDWLTIKAASGATPVFSQIKFQGTFSKIYLKGLTLLREAYGTDPEESGFWYDNDEATGELLLLESVPFNGDAHDVKVNGLSIMAADNTNSSPGNANAVSTWSESDWENYIGKTLSGVSVEGVTNTEIVNSNIENVSIAASFSKSSNYSYFVNNTLLNFTVDGARMISNYLYVAGNTITDPCGIYVWDENHYDGIQSYSVGAGGVGTGIIQDVIIRGNTIISDTGKAYFSTMMQGIGCFDGYYKNWIVENNLIVVSHYHGITFYGMINSVIVNNTVLDFDDTDSLSPWIMIHDHKNGGLSEDSMVANNIVSRLISVEGTAVSQRYNYVIGSDGFSDMPLYFVDPDNLDFHLLSNSYTDTNIVDKGGYFSNFISSEYDKDGDPRDNHPDLGAFEL